MVNVYKCTMNNNKQLCYVLLNVAVDVFDEDDDDNYDWNDNCNILEKIDNYAEEIVPRMRTGQFRQHFRMLPDTFEHLLSKLNSVWDHSVHRGHPEINLDKQLMITLWYISNLESFRSVADRFGISKSACWSILYRVCKKMLLLNKVSKIIAWPSEDRAIRIIQKNYNRTKFPGVVGAIDGSHIPIKAPKTSPTSYVCRKGFHSILLQAVCENNMLFIDCYTGEAGSIHDSCLFRRSDLYSKINNGDIQFPNNSHLVGDPAYTLTTYLMVPFKDNAHLTERQKNYNYLLSKSRVVIEQSFALLKGRFRRLKMMETVRLDLIPILIMTACILHNVCILENDILDLDLEAEIWEERTMNTKEVSEILEHQGVIKRNDIANALPQKI